MRRGGSSGECSRRSGPDTSSPSTGSCASSPPTSTSPGTRVSPPSSASSPATATCSASPVARARSGARRAWAGCSRAGPAEGTSRPRRSSARNRLARSGVVAVAVTVARDTGAYIGLPQLIGRGLTRDEEGVLASAALDLVPLLEELSPAVRGDDAYLREAMVRITRQVFRERAARRPCDPAAAAPHLSVPSGGAPRHSPRCATRLAGERPRPRRRALV